MGAFGRIWERFGAFRSIWEHVRACLIILDLFGAFWTILGAFWSMLDHFGAFWSILEHTGRNLVFWRSAKMGLAQPAELATLVLPINIKLNLFQILLMPMSNADTILASASESKCLYSRWMACHSSGEFKE